MLLIILFLPLVIQPDSIAHADGPAVEYWAVIVGVSNYLYQDDLNYADDNAASLYQQLAPVIGSDHIDLLTNWNADKGDVQSSIQNWLAPREGSNDVVLFYFAGHGSEYLGNYDICPHDGNPYLLSSFIWDYDLNSWLSPLDSNNIVVILDTCESGGFITDLSSISQVVMASSAASESSWYDSSIQHGVFTYYLLQAINSATVADTNADYVLTTREIFNYVSPRTTQYLMQYGYTQHPVNYDSGLALFTIAAIGANVASGSITVDGTNYTSQNFPYSLLMMPNSSHSVTVPSQIDSGTDTRRIFLSWSDGSNTLTKTISQGGQYTANYGIQYLLNVQSSRGSVTGTGWYDSGASASTGAAEQTVYSGSTIRYVFQHWNVDGVLKTENPITVSMYSPHTAVADYKTQYYFDVQSGRGSVSGTGWYDSGASASTGTAEQTIYDGDTRYVFQSWNIDGIARTGNPATVYMSKYHTAMADYTTQYNLEVSSKYGDVYGSGWYDSGTTAQISVSPVVGTLIRHKFVAWSGDYTNDEASDSVYMNQPKSIVATWKTDYLYLYLLIGGVIGIVALLVVALIVHGRGGRVSKQKRYAHR